MLKNNDDEENTSLAPDDKDSNKTPIDKDLDNEEDLDDEEDSVYPQIGAFSDMAIMKLTPFDDEIKVVMKKTEQLPENPKDTAKNIKIKKVKVDIPDPSQGAILGKTVITDGEKTRIEFSVLADKKQLANFDEGLIKEYFSDNPIIKNIVREHELGHVIDQTYFNMADTTPMNVVRFNNFGERKGNAVEVLGVVDAYHTLKSQGITTFEYGGKKSIPIDQILDPYPHLRETVEKNGSDLNNPNTVRALVNVSKHCFDTHRKDLYEEQIGLSFMQADSVVLPYQEELRRAREEDSYFDTTVNDMLKQVKIGHRYIDLQNCKDLLVEPKEYFNNILLKDEDYIPTEAKIKIDDHLKEIGIPAQDRPQYIIDQYDKIIAKEDDADQKLKELMALANKNYTTITYQDGSTEVFEAPDKKVEKILLGKQIKKDEIETKQQLEKAMVELESKEPKKTEKINNQPTLTAMSIPNNNQSSR